MVILVSFYLQRLIKLRHPIKDGGRQKPRRGRVVEDGNLSERQVVIPPEEPDDYEPKREPIFQPGMLEVSVNAVLFFFAMILVHKVIKWVIVDILGIFPQH